MNDTWCIVIMLSLICVQICVQEWWLWTAICREGGTFVFSAIRLKLKVKFSEIYCTFNFMKLWEYFLCARLYPTILSPPCKSSVRVHESTTTHVLCCWCRSWHRTRMRCTFFASRGMYTHALWNSCEQIWTMFLLPFWAYNVPVVLRSM